MREPKGVKTYEWPWRFERSGGASMNCLVECEIDREAQTFFVFIKDKNSARSAAAAADYRPIRLRDRTIGFAILETPVSADCNATRRLELEADGSLQAAARRFAGVVASRAVDGWIGPREG